MCDLLGGMFGGQPDWLAALLAVEAALARAKAATGRIPGAAAETIAEHCRRDLFDESSLAERAAAHATPVVPLVEDLRALLPADLADAVHRPATSQDVIDSAMMLIASRTLTDATADLTACTGALTRLADVHRDTPYLARTLLAAALPSTFGRLAGGWSAGLTDARATLDRAPLPAQLGGPIGTLDDPELVAAFAGGLGLAEPTACWHTNRTPVATLVSGLGMVIGALGKIAGDVVLLSAFGEVAEGSPGGSSAMPDKQNSSRSVQILACAHRAPALVGTIFAGLPQELERAAGRWQAEWRTVGELLGLLRAAARHGRVLLTELVVDVDRMRKSLP
jgi:3-carboxy-cis,cis-muconate cycloisomerase